MTTTEKKSGEVEFGRVDQADTGGGAFTGGFAETAARELAPRLRPRVVDVLPANPALGEEVYFKASADVRWHLVYEPDGNPNPWRYVGGPPLTSAVSTQESTTSTTYVDLATVGPSITAPLSGDYVYAFDCYDNSATPDTGYASVKFGSAATADADGKLVTVTLAGAFGSPVKSPTRKNGLIAGDVVKMQYRSIGGTLMQFGFRSLSLIPVRVG